MSNLTIYDSTDIQEVDDQHNLDDLKTFYHLLYKLNQATLLLSQATSMSGLYRTAVITATTLLDIDRIGILMLDEQQKYLSGTWGTNAQGELQNEYKFTIPVDNEIRNVIKNVDNQGKVCIWKNKPLYEFQEDKAHNSVAGIGWNGVIALWEEGKVIGWIACDNLLQHRPFKPYMSHVLRLFGSIISEYRLRFLALEKIETINKSLAIKVQELQQTITKLEETKIQLNTVQTQNAVKDLVVGVAHEINTPLGTAIMANSNYPSILKGISLAVEENDKKSIQSLLVDAEKTIQILDNTSSIITEFKRLSTIEIESIPAQKVILAPWLKGVIRTIRCFEPALQELDIKLNIDHPETTIFVHDEVLSQVIKELLLNALLHGDQRGIKSIVISLKVKNEQLQLSIEDNGSRVALNMQHKIFNPFITTARALGRKGLGLNMVTNLVIFLLKGKLSYFDSDLGGAGFSISCPIKLAE